MKKPKLTKEEQNLLQMYRDLSRWEKNAAYILLQSIAWGELNAEKTDTMPWSTLARSIGLPK